MATEPIKIKMFGMDVDGVLTDGGIGYGDGNLEIKRFHAHDGMGITLLRLAGVTPFLITGRRCAAVDRRGRELGVTEIHQGVEDKLACLKELAARHAAGLGEIAFVGDDLPDLEVLRSVGYPVAVANARQEIKQAARFVTSARGGDGAVREAIEWALRLNGQWADLVRAFHARRRPGDASG
ncbi:MAG: HAD hydrolase family protein [bacterium]